MLLCQILLGLKLTMNNLNVFVHSFFDRELFFFYPLSNQKENVFIHSEVSSTLKAICYMTNI